MRTTFQSFIKENSLFTKDQTILLAVSGGVDSMVMLHLFNQCNYNIAVAHCNFQLRGADSDADQQLVFDTCEALGIKCHIKSFDTTGYAREKKITIQEAAREIRYSWFTQLRKEYNYPLVAIAHNKNDVAETMLINLTRGTGLKGLTGIKLLTNGVIRPILFALRTDIKKYAKAENVRFREDVTNTEVHYARNRIRHRVIPQLEKINPAAVLNLYGTSGFLNRTWLAIEKMNEQLMGKVKKESGEEVWYHIKTLLDFPFYHLFLLEELRDYGFSPSAVEDICQSLQGQPGKVFYSHTHQLVKDREYLMLMRADAVERKTMSIASPEDVVNSPISLRFKVIFASDLKEFSTDDSVAYFDMDAIEFPLTLRPWQQGDRFVPFGMKGHKKLSDFLIDQKVPLHHKRDILVLLSNHEIIWVVGHRADNRFRVTTNTQRVLVISTEEGE